MSGFMQKLSFWHHLLSSMLLDFNFFLLWNTKGDHFDLLASFFVKYNESEWRLNFKCKAALTQSAYK